MSVVRVFTGGELPGKVHGGAPVGNNGRVGNWPSRAESPPKKMKLSKNPNGEEKKIKSTHVVSKIKIKKKDKRHSHYPGTPAPPMRSSPTSALVPASLVLQSHQKIRYVSIDCDFDSDWSMIVDHHKRSISGQKPAKDAGQRATRGGSLSWTNISRRLLQMSVLTIGLSSTLMWMLKEQVADWLVTGLLALPTIL